MKVNRLFLKENEKTVLEEDVDFSNIFFDANHVKRIPKCHVKLTLVQYETILSCDMEITADVIASCAYTLEDVPLKRHLIEKMYFSDEESDADSDDVYYEKNNEIDMDPYVLSFIITSVPHNIHKKGAKLPSGGDGYRVLTEEEYIKEHQEKKNSPFDVLDDLELDD